ncbi:MAG TPA: hypothetical protein VKB42_07580 [Dongiaceae bacterium]|nr:hypothetical protein [Dongiaceae bacterium]
MTISDIERNHYYPQQYLGAADFEDQQAYGRDMRRRHNLGPHSWGIIAGLELVEKPRESDPGFVDVYIMPGEAVDGFGREIVVLEPTLLDTAPFQIFANSQSHAIWIAYDEQALRTPTGGFVSCESTDQYSRIRETFKILVSPPDPQTDGITVGGITVPNNNPSPDDPKIPLDGSVSYQELPSPTDTARWPVRLGSAFWDGPTGKFKTAGAQLLQGRSYAGLIGASVLSPTGELRLASRATTPTAALATHVPGPAGRIDVDANLVITGNTHIWGASSISTISAAPTTACRSGCSATRRRLAAAARTCASISATRRIRRRGSPSVPAPRRTRKRPCSPCAATTRWISPAARCASARTRAR